MPKGLFTGFKAVEVKISDFLFGGETAISNTPRNDSCDWRPEKPAPKTQIIANASGQELTDTCACSDFSAINDLATQMDWLIEHGQLAPHAVNFLKSNGYIDASGKVSLSPRFTAVMSGTSPTAGNSLPNVWSSIKNNGVVPDSLWPMPTDIFNKIVANPGPNMTQQLLSAYYASIPDSVKAVGKQFLQWFSIQYEWVAWEGNEKSMADLAGLLTVAPLQIVTAVCPGWGESAPIPACGDGTQHATALLNVEQNVAYDIMDTYVPYTKQLSPAYSISYAMRGVINNVVQNPAATPPFTYNYMVSLTFGAPPGPEVKALQQGLQTLSDKTGKPYMAPGVFGPYGPQTQVALAKFQVDNGISDDPQGSHFGPKSRGILTKELADLAQKVSGEPLPRPLNPDAHRPN